MYSMHFRKLMINMVCHQFKVEIGRYAAVLWGWKPSILGWVILSLPLAERCRHWGVMDVAVCGAAYRFIIKHHAVRWPYLLCSLIAMWWEELSGAIIKNPVCVCLCLFWHLCISWFCVHMMCISNLIAEKNYFWFVCSNIKIWSSTSVLNIEMFLEQ